MKIGFLTDTNFFTTGIHNSHESKYLLKNMDIFIDYVSDLRAAKSKNKLFYCVPDLVYKS